MKSVAGIKMDFSCKDQMNWNPPLNRWGKESCGWFKYWDKEEVSSIHYFLLGKALYQDLKMGAEDKFWSLENSCEYSYEGKDYRMQIKVRHQPGYTEVEYKINNN